MILGLGLGLGSLVLGLGLGLEGQILGLGLGLGGDSLNPRARGRDEARKYVQNFERISRMCVLCVLCMTLMMCVCDIVCNFLTWKRQNMRRFMFFLLVLTPKE